MNLRCLLSWAAKCGLSLRQRVTVSRAKPTVSAFSFSYKTLRTAFNPIFKLRSNSRPLHLTLQVNGER